MINYLLISLKVMIILLISHIGPMQGCTTLAPPSPYNVALKKATRKSLLLLHKDHMLGALYFTGSLQFFHRALAPIMIVRFVGL